MKKLLILGAMEMHVPLIKRAKERGIYVIVCDYLPDAPGHKIADESYLDSTTDKEAILARAISCKIDAIMTFVSDPAAQTAAYVAEKLDLPGNPFEAVRKMSEKDLFRALLKGLGLNAPHFLSVENAHEVNVDEFHFPVIVKPVDSSGSKGANVVENRFELKNAIEYAMTFSRSKRCILEEYIEPLGPQLHGDGFVLDGELKALWLGDHHFDEGSFVPYSTTLPSTHSQKHLDACFFEVAEFIKKSGFKNGGINVELRINKRDEKAYIIDIGARNGGNFTPNLTKHFSGFDAQEAALDLALGNAEIVRENFKLLKKPYGFFSNFVLHANQSGYISSVEFSPELQTRLVEEHVYVKPGDFVEPFTGANKALGVLILKYKNNEDMQQIVENASEFYNVKFAEKDDSQIGGGVQPKEL